MAGWLASLAAATHSCTRGVGQAEEAEHRTREVHLNNSKQIIMWTVTLA